MNRESEFVARLTGDPALMSILTGGVYAYTAIRRLGLTLASTPAAFDADGFLLPCAVVKERGPVVDPTIDDISGQITARRQMFEIWVYEDTDYSAIEAAIVRIFQLLQGHRFPSAWPAAWTFTTAPLIDEGSLAGASVKRVDYLIVDLLKGVAA